MAKVLTDDKYYKAIANLIRQVVGGTQAYRPDELEENLIAASEARFNHGYADGEAAGIVAGREAQNKEFWDKYFEGVENAGRMYTFSGTSWNTNTFYPTQDIPLGTGTFFYFSYYYSAFSLTDRLNECGVKLLAADNGAQIFQNAWFTEIPEIDLSQITSLAQTFNGARMLKTIEGLILKEAGTNTFDRTFRNCSALQEIKSITGKIGRSVDFGDCTKFTYETIMRIIGALMDYSETNTGAYTLTLGSTNLAKLTDEEKAIATGKGWNLA